MVKVNSIPTDPFLYDLLLTMNDEKSYQLAREWWQATGLPNPEASVNPEPLQSAESSQYLYNEDGMSVFLNPLGLSIHFRSKSFGKGAVYKGYMVEDGNILQPLAQFQAGKTSLIEVLPGIERPGTKNSVLNALSSRMARHGLAFQDKHEGYVGILPGVGRGKVVVANRSKVKVKSGKNNDSALPISTQTKIFGGLADEMSAALNSGSQASIRSIFGECAKITALEDSHPDKILRASWTNESVLGPKQSDIVKAAKSYGETLHAWL